MMDLNVALGHASVWAEEFDSAIAETELAVELNPSNAHARSALGNRLDLVARTAEGIAQMQRALELNPQDPLRSIPAGEGHARMPWRNHGCRKNNEQNRCHCPDG